jgi:hypothetical protein
VKLTRDEPGELLLLQGEAFGIPPSVAKGVVVIAAVVVATVLGWSVASTLGSLRQGWGDTAFVVLRSLFWLGIIGGVLITLRRSLWLRHTLWVDRRASKLSVGERKAFTGGARDKTVRLLQPRAPAPGHGGRRPALVF